MSESHENESSQNSVKSRWNSVGLEICSVDDDLTQFGRFPVDVESNFKRFVEVGRVVLIKDGPLSGKIAVIAEIIDHNRAIIDGPSTGVPRQAFPYKHLLLTPLKLTKLPRGAGSGVIKKLVETEGVVEKWDKSAWAQKRVTKEKRQSLNDFDRFKVMLAKKQRRDIVRKALKKVSA
ncbi:60S ribosomal protein L14-B [Leucoagaricus sp. SymC.cos]|nr:60S ribosomal protein L14-B [Leucoagaricus sp. SymC.cos]